MLGKGLSYREYSYGKKTEKQWEPTPGVHLREMSLLQRCPLKESGQYAHGGQRQQSSAHPLSIFYCSLKGHFSMLKGSIFQWDESFVFIFAPPFPFSYFPL